MIFSDIQVLFLHFFKKHDCEVIKYGHVNPLTTPFLIICQSARLLLRKLFLLELVVMLFLNTLILFLTSCGASCPLILDFIRRVSYFHIGGC